MRIARAGLVLLPVLLASCMAAEKSNAPSASAAKLIEELRIGSADGGPAGFGRVAALEADAAGNVYVVDGLAQEVRVFAADGRHLRTFGREGAGPGEFRMISGMAWDPHGRLWVMDPVLSRLSAFDTAGTFQGSLARAASRAVTIPWLGSLDAEGRVYDPTAAPPSASRPGEARAILVRYRAERERLAPIDTLALPPAAGEIFEARTADGGRFRSPAPFTSAQRWRLAPDGSVWIGMTGSYRLARIAFGGDTLAMLRHAATPLAVTAAERDSIATADGIPPDRIPGVKPAIRSFFIDEEGRVWVAPHLAPGTGSGWDVFSPAGAHLGHVTTDLEIETEDPSPIVRGGALYAVTRGELDVPFVVRMRVPPLP